MRRALWNRELNGKGIRFHMNLFANGEKLLRSPIRDRNVRQSLSHSDARDEPVFLDTGFPSYLSGANDQGGLREDGLRDRLLRGQGMLRDHAAASDAAADSRDIASGYPACGDQIARFCAALFSSACVAILRHSR
jgi:hypothetical protein